MPRPLRVDERVGGAEVDGEVASQRLLPGSGGVGPAAGGRPNRHAAVGTCRGATTRRDSGASACISRWNSLMPVSMRLGSRLRQHQHRRAERAEPEREQEEAGRCSRRSTCGRRLSVTEVLGVQAPAPAAGPGLPLPDRHRRLQRVDAEPGGLERLVPMGRRRGDHDRGRRRSRVGPVRCSSASRPVVASGGGPRRRWPRAGARPAPRRPRTRAAARRPDPRRGRAPCR